MKFKRKMKSRMKKQTMWKTKTRKKQMVKISAVVMMAKVLLPMTAKVIKRNRIKLKLLSRLKS